jgi:serine/threonine-protein kinase
LVAWAEWDWETADREWRRAIELDPGDPRAPAVYAHLLIALKRPAGAVSQAERATRLDPLNAFNRALYGLILYFVRQYDRAGEELLRARATIPDTPIVHCGLWQTYNVSGRPDQALTAAEGCIGHYDPAVKEAPARGYAAAGYTGAMRQAGDLLAGGLKGVYVAPIDVFLAYVHAGERDLALDWLSKSVDVREPNVYGAVRDPFVTDALGGDPRFEAILRRARLPL